MHTIKNNGCFSSIGRHCKWCNWKRACVKRLTGFAGTWWQLAHQPFWGQSVFERTVRRAAAGVGAQHSEEPCAACATGDVHTGVPSNWGIPEGAGQPIGTVPVDPEPSHASRVGRNYLHLSQVYQIPTMQLNRPTLKRNLKWEPVFLM